MQNALIPAVDRVTVAVDAMGGDKAPQAVINGALAAARTLPQANIILIGDETTIRSLLTSAGKQPDNIVIKHTSQVIEMCDAATAIRQKRDSSIVVGMRLVRDGHAHAIVSAGSSAAMVAGAMLIVKPQVGIDRPGIATFLPSQRGPIVLLDAGATADCKPINLVQFARLGSAYAQQVLDKARPKVGLLSIGEEASKGDELTKETHKLLLTEDEVNFTGNVEPKEVLHGEVDVVICDGFVGNLMLKAGEGFGELIMGMIKTEIAKGWVSRLAALLLKPSLLRVKRVFDYAEYGGMELLGVNGIVIICHGRSNAQAIENAIRVAARAAQRRMVDAVARLQNCELNRVMS